MTSIETGFGLPTSIAAPDGPAFAGLMATGVSDAEEQAFRHCRLLLGQAYELSSLAETHLNASMDAYHRGDDAGVRHHVERAADVFSELSGMLDELLGPCARSGALSPGEITDLEWMKREVDQFRFAGQGGRGDVDFAQAGLNFIGGAASALWSMLQRLLNRSPDGAY